MPSSRMHRWTDVHFAILGPRMQAVLKHYLMNCSILPSISCATPPDSCPVARVRVMVVTLMKEHFCQQGELLCRPIGTVRKCYKCVKNLKRFLSLYGVTESIEDNVTINTKTFKFVELADAGVASRRVIRHHLFLSFLEGR